MAQFLGDYPQIDAVLSANDGMALGALEAMKEANRTAVVIGIVGMGLVFDAASNGNMRELSFGIPALFLGLWWAGHELGMSILVSRARKAGQPRNP